MVSTAPLIHTLWSSYARNSYRPAESTLVFQGRTQRARNRVPVVFCHGYGGLPVDFQRDGVYMDDFRGISSYFPVLAADLGGTTTWGNDDSIDAIDDLLTYASNPAGIPLFEVRSDKVALFGESMGALLALNWAWRNPEQVVAVVLRAPVIALESFYDANVAFQGAINTAYGGTLDESDLDDHDPMRNLDLIRPFGDRIKLWAMESDEFVPVSEVEAFATLVGAEFDTNPGTHADALNVGADEITTFLLSASRKQKSFYWTWQDESWEAMERLPITVSDSIPYDKTEAVTPVGRRAFASPISGTFAANDRTLYVFPDFEAVDSEMMTTLYSGDPVVAGQQGNFHRIIHDEAADEAAAYVIWQNIIFGSPWILNVGVWHFKPTAGGPGSTGFDTNQSGSFTPAGLKEQTGGTILASFRTSNVVTLVCNFYTTPQVGDLIEVTDLSEATFNGPQTVTSVGAGTLTYTDSGSDVPSGGSGYFGNHSRTFPYFLRTQVRGTTAYIKAWKGDFEPSWDNPDFASTVAFEGGHHTGYGRNGILIAHAQAAGLAIGQGPVYCAEL